MCDNVMYSSCVCVTVCFVQTIVSWSGSKSNMFERQKVREFAALIRDTERHSKAQIIDAAEGEEPLEMIEVRGQNKENSHEHIAEHRH